MVIIGSIRMASLGLWFESQEAFQLSEVHKVVFVGYSFSDHLPAGAFEEMFLGNDLVAMAEETFKFVGEDCDQMIYVC